MAATHQTIWPTLRPAIVARSDAGEWEHIIRFTRPAASGELA